MMMDQFLGRPLWAAPASSLSEEMLLIHGPSLLDHEGRSFGSRVFPHPVPAAVAPRPRDCLHGGASQAFSSPGLGFL